MYRKRIGEKAPYQPPLPDPTKTGSLLYNLEREICFQQFCTTCSNKRICKKVKKTTKNKCGSYQHLYRKPVWKLSVHPHRYGLIDMDRQKPINNKILVRA